MISDISRIVGIVGISEIVWICDIYGISGIVGKSGIVWISGDIRNSKDSGISDIVARVRISEIVGI